MADARAEFSPPASPRIRFNIICVAGENWGVYGDENFLEPSVTYGEAGCEAGAGDAFVAADGGAAGAVPLLSPALPAATDVTDVPTVELGSAMFSCSEDFGLQVGLLGIA